MAKPAVPNQPSPRAVLCARLAADKHAAHVLILALQELEGAPAEYFVIASVESDSQMKAVIDSITRTMKETGNGSARKDAVGDSSWAVLDFFDVVVHVMDTELREFYNLERLWGDARAYGINGDGEAHELSAVPRRSAQS